MISLALVMSVLLAGSAPSSQEVRQEAQALTEYVRVLNPALSRERSAQLGWRIHAAAKQFGIDPYLMAAIVRLESNFESVKACWDAPWNKENPITCDWGLGQINDVWLKTWNLDPEKLLREDMYNLTVMARLLRDLYRQFGAQDSHWYSLYHNNVQHYRDIWEAKLEAFLALRPVVSPQQQ